MGWLTVSHKLQKTLREREKKINSVPLDGHYCLSGTTGHAFRGDEESSPSLNRGNFSELMDVLDKYDSVIKLHLDIKIKIKINLRL